MARDVIRVLAVALVLVGCSGGSDPAPAPCSEQAAGCAPPPDMTPPTVLSRFPSTPSVLDYAPGLPFMVTFSEALDPATVNVSTVRVYDDGALVPSSVWLENDQTIQIVPERLTLPGWVFVELTPGIADLAGNAFAGETAPWTFDVREPEWGKPAPVWSETGPNPTPSVAIDAHGNAVFGLGGFDQVVRHEGSVWQPLYPPRFSLSAHVISDANGDVWMADDDDSSIQVFRLTDSGWTQFGDDLASGAGYPWDVFFVPRAENPLVVFNACQFDGNACHVSLQVRAREGDGVWRSWGSVDEELLFLDVAAAPDGDAFVIGSLPTVGARVFHLTSGGPVPLADLDHGGYGDGTTSIAVGGDGLPIVAVPEPGVGVRVLKWNGMSWDPVGAPVHVAAAPAFMLTDLAVDGAGAPVLAWAEQTAAEPALLYMATWTAANGWTPTATPLNADPTHDVYDVALTADRGGGRVLVWPEATGETGIDADGLPYTIFRFMTVNR